MTINSNTTTNNNSNTVNAYCGVIRWLYYCVIINND